jgi:hypothetical protein
MNRETIYFFCLIFLNLLQSGFKAILRRENLLSGRAFSRWPLVRLQKGLPESTPKGWRGMEDGPAGCALAIRLV